METGNDRNDMVVEISGLCRRFGRKSALEDITLSVRRGTVHGLVGENGAGKTTLIRHLLGLHQAQKGTVRVFGIDPVKDPVRVLSNIGYLSEERDLPGWMRVREFMQYTRAFYPSWDTAYADSLAKQFGLDVRQPIRLLSRGERARVGLLAALAHRPALLLLDEPSSGLDPLARRDILEAIVRTVADEGRTVVFSSHLLEEVERVADNVAMISGSRLVLAGALDEVRLRHTLCEVDFENPVDRPPPVAGVCGWMGSGRAWTCVRTDAGTAVAGALAAAGGRLASERTATLPEIFFARTGRRTDGNGEERP